MTAIQLHERGVGGFVFKSRYVTLHNSPISVNISTGLGMSKHFQECIRYDKREEQSKLT